MVECDDGLDGCCHFAVDAAFHQGVHLVLVFEHLFGVLVYIFRRDVRHAVLGELHAGGQLGHFLDVVVVHFDVIGLDELPLDEAPSEVFDAFGVVVLDELVVLVGIVGLDDAFEQAVGVRELAHLINKVFAGLS